jgi:trk system potassium uptake protein TrkA
MGREYAVLGLGQFGVGVALALERRGSTVVGVDHIRAVVQELSEQLADVVEADACDEAALRMIGVADFDAVIVAIGDFEANLLAVVALRHLGVGNVIAKALTSRQAEILAKIGAHSVVLPEQEAGERLAARLVAPGIEHALLEQVGVAAGERAVPSEWIGKTLAQLKVRQRYGVLAIALRRGADLITAPAPDVRLAEADQLVFVGPEAQLKALGCRLSPAPAQ